MPVTPKFSLWQDDDFVFVRLRVPYVRVSDLEYTIDGAAVSVYVKPYLLKLSLPGAVEDDERTKAEYDPLEENGTVTLHLPKREKARHFEDLDLLTRLREPAKARVALQPGAAGAKARKADAPRQPTQPLSREDSGAAAPLIQVLSSMNFDDKDEDAEGGAAAVKKPDERAHEAAEDNGEAPKPNGGSPESAPSSAAAGTSLPKPGAETEAYLASLMEQTTLEDKADREESDAVSRLGLESPKYGFNHGMEGFFRDILTEFPELVDLPEPDSTPEAERRSDREEAENAAFDVDRYLGDLVGVDDDAFYQAAMDFDGPEDIGSGFSDAEQDQMRQLRNREFLKFSPSEEERALCAILDVSLAYLYDLRTTQAEHNVESAWTIRVLSPTLSWLDAFTDVGETVRAVAHRGIIYPYIRHLSLVARMLEDAKRVLEQGRRGLLRCLLGVHRIFARSDVFYLLNRLYITEMAIWIQQADAAVVDEFCSRAAACVSFYAADPYKALRWDLRALEAKIFAGGDGFDADYGEAHSSASSSSSSSSSESGSDSDSEDDSSSDSGSESSSDSEDDGEQADDKNEDEHEDNGASSQDAVAPPAVAPLIQEINPDAEKASDQ